MENCNVKSGRLFGHNTKKKYFLVSAHSETVEKVEKICIKLNFNQKNSNSAWTLPWWELRKFHGPWNIFGFSYENQGGKQSPLMTLAYFCLLYPNMAFILEKKIFLGQVGL